MERGMVCMLHTEMTADSVDTQNCEKIVRHTLPSVTIRLPTEYIHSPQAHNPIRSC